MTNHIQACLAHIDKLEAALPMDTTEDTKLYVESLRFGERVAKSKPTKRLIMACIAHIDKLADRLSLHTSDERDLYFNSLHVTSTLRLMHKPTKKSRLKMRKAVAAFQKYVAEYTKETHYEEYSEETFIEDILYGLGFSLDEKYRGIDGYAAFLKRLPT